MHHINSSICKREEKKKARITQLETYKYEGILSNKGEKIEYLQEEEDCKKLNRRKGEEGKTFLSNSIFM